MSQAFIKLTNLNASSDVVCVNTDSINYFTPYGLGTEINGNNFTIFVQEPYEIVCLMLTELGFFVKEIKNEIRNTR